MRVNEAKDIVVGEIERQATMEGVSLSDLERRLMRFTEEGDCPDDLSALDEGFESEKEVKQYETKISGLARRAHQRVKKENSAGLQLWDEAVRELKKDDHYLLVMLRMRRREGSFSFSSFLITLGLGLLIVVVLLIVIVALDHYGFLPDNTSSRRGVPTNGTFAQVPVWIQRALLVVLAAGYIYIVAAQARVNRFLGDSMLKMIKILRKK